ncbi:transporter substrate-binding domain-containing protein [Streptococcus dentapri]|uniref:Transporter substrate-binding domain-containing protein n=1 Tax=Streptococcus dentapri TaxID=573564 RepID=A0ABV8D3D2_9STRE
MSVKKFFVAFMVAVTAVSLVACASFSKSSQKEDTSLSDVQKRGTLVVATSPDFAPFEFKTLKNGKDTVAGIDVELTKEIGKELGVDVHFLNVSFSNVLASVAVGKADYGISGISVTEDRKNSYEFTDTYFESKNVVVIRKSDLNTYTSVDSFAGKSVSAQKGTIQEGVLTDQIPKASAVSLTQNSEGVNELKGGQISGIVMESAIAEGYVSTNDDLTIANITLKEVDGSSYAIALPKGSIALRNKINTIIRRLKKEGKIDEYVKKANKDSESQ